MKIRITGCDIDVKQKKNDIIDIANGKREFSLYFFITSSASLYSIIDLGFSLLTFNNALLIILLST